MKKTALFILSMVSLLFLGVNHLYAQQKVILPADWHFILGDWVGDATGKPGEGVGSFSFNQDLDGNILVKKGRTVFPPANGKPGIVHDDILVVYLDNAGALSKAIYFDNENHVINYAVSYNQADRSLILTSDIQQNLPRFRLIFKYINNNSLGMDFEMTQPNQPDSFFKYVSGKVHRKTTNEKSN
jgi:hypothetical protein